MFFYTLIFSSGLVIGSFLNVVIYRLHSGEEIVKTRSHCFKCGHVLTWYELVPIFSFIFQRGRCRACSAGISLQYPLVEFATATLFTLVIFFTQGPFRHSFSEVGGLALGWNFFDLGYLLTITSLLIIIFVYDLKHYIIPNKVIYPAIFIALVYQILSSFGFDVSLGTWDFALKSLMPIFLSAFFASAFFAAIFFISRGKWLGFGDVNLAFFMGIFLGWPGILVAFFVTFMLGGIIGLGLIATGKKGMKSQVPFGPYLVAGTFVALFWGKEIAEWYLGLFV